MSIVIKLLLFTSGVLLLAAGLAVAAGEANVWAEQQAYVAVMTTRARFPDAEASAAAATLSRWEPRSPPAVARKELEILERAVAQGAGRPAVALELRLGTAARKLVAVSPLNGRAWCALSELAMRTRAEPADMARALARCHSTARFEFELMSRRLMQSSLMWPVLSQELRQAALTELRQLLASPEQGLQMAERVGRLVALVSPERAADFAPVVAAQEPRIQAVYSRTIDYHAKQADAMSRQR